MENELNRAVASVRSLFGAAACSVGLTDAAGTDLEFVAADGEGAEQIIGVRLPVSRGIAGWAAMSGQPIAVRDVVADPRFARDVAESTHYVPTSLLAAPIFDTDGEVVGVLSVLDPTVDATADWTLAVLGTLAALVGQVVGGGAPATSSPLEDLGRRVLEAVARYDAPGTS
jgi:signal transduction protein with GAF and PtsI domain